MKTMQEWIASVMVDDLSERPSELLAEAQPIDLQRERLLTAQAMLLLIRIDLEILEARADWNQDRFRRVMRARPKAVSRLLRRLQVLNRQPTLPLGSLRRRYHANLARYLYEPQIQSPHVLIALPGILGRGALLSSILPAPETAVRGG